MCFIFESSTCKELRARTVPNLSSLISTQDIFDESEFQFLDQDENNLIIEILN